MPTPVLPLRARLYLAIVITIGAAILLYSFGRWQSADLERFLGYLSLASVIATWKVRLPDLPGTISPAYVITLMAIASLSFPEAVVIGGVGAMVQSLWRPRQRPLAVQVAFNLCSSMAATALAFAACRWLLWPIASKSIFVLLLTAALVQYAVSTVLVAVVVCLVENRPVLAIWSRCHFWALPHYMVGATTVGVMMASQEVVGWLGLTGVLAVLLLLWVSYRARLARPAEGA